MKCIYCFNELSETKDKHNPKKIDISCVECGLIDYYYIGMDNKPEKERNG